MAIQSVILTSGGKHRMEGLRPKVLYPLCGEPILGHVLRAVEALGIQHITLVAQKKAIEEFVGNRGVVVYQGDSNGSAEALCYARKRIEEFDENVLVVYGDRPFIKPSTLDRLVSECESQAAAGALLSVFMTKPEGYGRVVRHENGLVARMPRDCDLLLTEDRFVREVVAGVFYFNKHALLAFLDSFERDPNMDFLMTDIINHMAQHQKIIAMRVPELTEVKGINCLEDLAEAEARLQTERMERRMSEVSGAAL